MRIVKANPAARFVPLPVQVLEAHSRGEIGKGELVTAVRLYRFLWGRQDLIEGTTSDFADVLELDIRVLQRHLPVLCSTGCLVCHRPQRGYWVISAPPAGLETTKVSFAVVAKHSFPPSVANKARPQQQARDDELPRSPPADSDLSPEQQAALQALLDQRLSHSAALRLCGEHDPERIQQVVRAAQGRNLRNPAGWVLRALREDWYLPEQERARGGHQPHDYISGKYAEYIQT